MKVEKDVFVRDQYGVRRRAFVAGTEVNEAAYNQAVGQSAEPTSISTKTLPEPEVLAEVFVEPVVSKVTEVDNKESTDKPNLMEPTAAEKKAAAKGKNK